MSQLKFTETVLRDGHQSQIATRMGIDEMVATLSSLDKVGYHALEVWGGATFDVCLRYLNENPWERLRIIKEHVKNTKLQMLLRGQNLLGYRHYPNDIVERFIHRSVSNGIDIIRVFDALNDTRNLETSITSIRKEGAHCQCAISYTTSQVHTVDYYIKLAKEMEQMGADSICIKDMAGILTPASAYDLVKGIKAKTDLPLELHGHSTSGICETTYYQAVLAGVDIIDTALSPFAGGTSQPSTESMYEVFKESKLAGGLNEIEMHGAAKHFNKIKESHITQGNFNPRVMKVEPKILKYQVPGGMLSNLLSQLEAQNAGDKYEDVLAEIPRVREDLGFPPLVTPLSQMVGTQAVFNVLVGERYKVIPKEIKEYCKGNYGQSPSPINEDVLKKAIGDEMPIDYCPADHMADGYEQAKEAIKELTTDEEMILAYAIFPEVTHDYLASSSRVEEIGFSNEVINIQIV